MTAEARGVLRDARAWSSLERVRSIAIGAAPLVLAFVLYTGVWLSIRPTPTGDEPHYLIAAESLIYDGDFDLANDYASSERKRTAYPVFESVPFEPHAYHYAGHESLTPFHGLGLSALLAPAVGLGGLTLARLMMILIAALVADQLFRLLRDLGVARPVYRWLAWAATVLSLPLVAFSNQIYPELPAALVVLVWLRVVIRPRPSPSALFGVSLGVATLPWLNVRYLSIFGLLVVGLLLAAARTYGDGTVRLRAVPRALWRARRPVTVFILVPALVSIVGLAVTFQVLYGSPSPDAPFRPLTNARLGSAGWDFWYGFLFGEFLSPLEGWIPYAPTAWLALVGLGCLLRVWRWRAASILAGIVVYLALVASTGIPVGWSFPARYVLVFIPLAAVPLAILLEAVWESRILFVPLLAVTVYVSYSLLGHTAYTLLYPSGTDRHEPSRFPAVRHFQTVFPNMRPPELRTEAKVVPAEKRHAVGRVEDGRVVAGTNDPPGFLLYNGIANLAPGLYSATFSLSGDGEGTRSIGRIEVVTTAGQALAARDLRAGDLAPAPKEFVLPFAMPDGVSVDARVWFAGGGRLSAGPTTLEDQPGTVRPPERFPDAALASAWIVGTGFLALLFAQLMALRGTAVGRPRT